VGPQCFLVSQPLDGSSTQTLAWLFVDIHPRLARYKIKSAIHRGSHSTIFVAQSNSGLACAIKVFAMNTTGPHKPIRASGSFLRELEVLCTSNHPNLVRLLEFGCTLDTGEEFLALEWLQGEDFVSASKKATRRGFYAMLAQACRALDYIHHRGMVHGDLKPHNLMVVPNSTPSPDTPATSRAASAA